MSAENKLSSKMTLTQFEHGYWYTSQLKEFAKKIGIPLVSKLRKDELENIIKHFLMTGQVQNTLNRNFRNKGKKDIEIGLKLDLPIKNYTNKKETKEFIIKEAKRISPELKIKSGVWYRLNRWREEKLFNNPATTYGDLVAEFVRLNKPEFKFSKIPHGRYINFVSDFLKNEKNANREEAIKAWEELKKMDVPKTYVDWKNS